MSFKAHKYSMTVSMYWFAGGFMGKRAKCPAGNMILPSALNINISTTFFGCNEFNPNSSLFLPAYVKHLLSFLKP